MSRKNVPKQPEVNLVKELAYLFDTVSYDGQLKNLGKVMIGHIEYGLITDVAAAGQGLIGKNIINGDSVTILRPNPGRSGAKLLRRSRRMNQNNLRFTVDVALADQSAPILLKIDDEVMEADDPHFEVFDRSIAIFPQPLDDTADMEARAAMGTPEYMSYAMFIARVVGLPDIAESPN